MAMPSHKDVMIPFLTYLRNKRERELADIKDGIAGIMNLDEVTLALSMDDGRNLFENRVEFANARLKIAGLVQSERFGWVQITDDGLQMLEENPNGIARFTEQCYHKFRRTR